MPYAELPLATLREQAAAERIAMIKSSAFYRTGESKGRHAA